MFRLNILQGLPVLAVRNENCFSTDFRHKPEKVPTWIFQEHTFVVPTKKTHLVRFFRVVVLMLMLQITTIIFLIAFSVLAVIHKIAMTLSLYWHFSWFDIPVHAFGGMIVALGFFTLRDLKLFPNKWLTLSRVFLLTLLITIAWELFEFLAGVPRDAAFVSDTILDICMGLSGSIIGFYIGTSLRNLR